ncbi:hypothetical protein AB751O23_AA_00310 [Chlamydiales bacterium SCGC AB-751-O23]|nr:hypothetical protein AB751O23_AA_00310 [Chlamydiales bacterium SCGC AB-751-O23]
MLIFYFLFFLNSFFKGLASFCLFLSYFLTVRGKYVINITCGFK